MINHQPKIEGLLLDFGRVLSDFDYTATCEKLASLTNGRLSGSEVRVKIFDGPAKTHEVGGMSPFEFHTKVCGLLGINLSFGEFCSIWQDILSPNVGIEDVLERVPASIRKAVCSNTEPIHWEAIRKLPVMIRFFKEDGMLARSYDPDIKARKPSEIIFNKALERLGNLRPENVLYVDDVPEYIEAFKKLGGNGIIYDASKMPIQYLEEQLLKYGVIE